MLPSNAAAGFQEALSQHLVRHIYVTKSVGENKGWKYAQLNANELV